ncbi:MAG: hypothetical protein CMB82_07790 [Flammeovirgaceae bacterium]|nr:hypothetical protein [Flammeovirgaceae bacterium]
MISYIKKKIEIWKIKRTYKKYGHHIEKFTLSTEGDIEFAVWDNPLEKPKKITQNSVDFYKRFVAKNSLAIDIGAHIGDTTVPLALAVGANGMTLAFDPNPNVFEILSLNSKLNLDKTNIRPFNYAIAEEPGEYYYNSSEATFDNGGISKEQKNKHGKYQLKNKVTAINLSSFLKENPDINLDKLSFIKVDVEGLDFEILSSIKNIISTYRPIIIAECFKKLKNEVRDNMFLLFDNLDFDCFKLEEFDGNEALEKLYKKEDLRNWKHFDFCMIPKEKSAGFYEHK